MERLSRCAFLPANGDEVKRAEYAVANPKTRINGARDCAKCNQRDHAVPKPQDRGPVSAKPPALLS